MKLHSSLLFFFIFFYFNECLVRTVHYKKQRMDGKIANYSYFIRRGKNQITELTKQFQLRKNLNYSADEGKEVIFSDVIKNITRVNNVLEDLIKNYEKLQHIDKSQETIEQDKLEESSDMEVDERYKKTNVRTPDVSKDAAVTKNSNGLATEKLFDKREEKQLAPKVNKEDHKKNGKIVHDTKDKRAPMIQFLRQPTKENVQSVTDTRDHLFEDNDNISSGTSSEYTESGTKDNKIQETPKIMKHNKISLDVDIPKTGRLVTEENTLDSSKNSSPITKTVIKTEQYTSDFWDNFANKAPTVYFRSLRDRHRKERLRNYHNKAVSTSFKSDENDDIRAVPAKAPSKFKSIHVNMGTTVEKGPVKLSNYTVQTQTKEPNLLKESMDWSVEDDKTIEKEQFKTSILRKAYGDACLKVVLKKCYKACKQVTRTGCVKYDCKPGFVKEFKNHAKAGCILEFSDETVIHKQHRAKSDAKETDNDFVDITRSGYLASACLPSKSRKSVTVVHRSTDNATLPPHGHQLNVLRDRFEMACQKASAEKCKRACYYATSQVCSTNDCKIGKKSNLARECRVHCKEAYRYTGEDKSDDSDTDADTRGMDESSSVSETTYNDSRPDPDFEEYLNSTTTTTTCNLKKATKSGVDSDSIMKVNMKLNRAFGYRNSKKQSML